MTLWAYFAVELFVQNLSVSSHARSMENSRLRIKQVMRPDGNFVWGPEEREKRGGPSLLGYYQLLKNPPKS